MRVNSSSLNNIKLLGFYFCLFILVSCVNTPSTPEPGNAKDIAGVNKRLNHQTEQIEAIEQKLISYQEILDKHSLMNDEISKLKNKLVTTLDRLNSNSANQEYFNILDKVQKKIEVLEDRTLYTDSLYFSIVKDMVLVENKISSLILSFKEMNDLSDNKNTKVIPQMSDEEYTAKYIESLSHYQNYDWDLSLNGFNYLMGVDNNHDLADNCQYWIGEVYYALKDYRRSIKEFEKVSSFLGTNKADDAQFKMGLCYMNIGQNDLAKNEFKKLLELYPNSEYHQRSQGYLRQD